MRCLIIGDTGEGKTLSMVALALHYYSLGYTLFANFHLKLIPFTFIDNSNFTKSLKFSEKHCVLIDEVGITTAKRNYLAINFSNLLAQSRKSIGEKSHLFMTTQSSQQINILIKGLLDYVMFPRLYRDMNDIPQFCVLEIHEKLANSPAFIPTKKKILRNLDKILEYYDTSELVNPFSGSDLQNLKKKYKYYVGAIRELKNLSVLLQEKEKLGITESERTARAIINDM